MDRPLLMAIVIAFLILLLALMLVGWRRRQKRQANFPRPRAVPDDLGASRLVVDAFYVATTLAGRPLERITVAGLGYRARAVVSVAERGLSLSIPGQDAIFIPAEDIRELEHATWTIDRVVEHDGLALVRWTIGDAGTTRIVLDSYLRVTDPVVAEQFFTAVQQLLGPIPQTDGTQTDSTQTGGHAR